MQEQQEQQAANLFSFLLILLASAIFFAFLPGLIFIPMLFSLTFFSRRNRLWPVGLLVFSLVGAAWHFWGGGLLEAYELFFMEFWEANVAIVVDGLPPWITLVKVWQRHLLFSILNGGFLFGGLFSMKWYFVGWKERDMRQQTWSLLLDSFGIRGPARERTRTKGIKRNKKINTMQHPDNGVLIGMEGRGKIIITDIEANMHSLLLGATGSGKTTTLLNYVESAAQRELPCIVVDAKGDPGLAEKIRAISGRYNRPFRVFSTRFENSTSYDPLRHGNALELADRMMACTDWSEEHYRLQAQRFLQIVFQIFERANIQPDLYSLPQLLSVEMLDGFLREIPDAKKAEELAQSLDETGHPLGLKNRLAVFSESELGVLFKKDSLVSIEEKGISRRKGIDLDRAVREKEIVLFSLDSLRYPEFVKMLGRLVTLDLKSIVSRVYEREAQKVFVLLDEFGAFANLHVSDFINKSRGAGFHILISAQEITDLELAVAGLADVVLANTNIKIIHRQDLPASCELISKTIGTYQESHITHKISGGEESGTIKREKSFYVHPDELKVLRQGEAFIVRKVPEFVINKAAIRQVRIGG